MRFLLAGGAGEMGRHLSGFLLDRGHEVVVLDKAASPAMGKGDGALTVIRGDLADKSLVVAAARGVDGIVNLAWSFSAAAATVFREDVCGHANLLAAAVAGQAKRFIFASTAAVYGAPQVETVTEEHPWLPAKARKPLYALGKLAAEELCGIYHREKGLATTIIRFWWTFGNTIGGRHLRDMIRAAINGEPLEIAAGAGGTFVTLDERWRLCCEKAARETGFRPSADSAGIRQAFRQALGRCADKVAAETAHV